MSNKCHYHESQAIYQLYRIIYVIRLSGLTPDFKHLANNMKQLSRIRVKNVDANFEREPLFPFHFKGSVINEIWQTAAYLEGESGISTIGLGGQSILCSD